MLYEELDGPAVSALRRAIAEFKQRWSVIGWVKIYYLELLRASEGKLSPAAFAVIKNPPTRSGPAWL
jgi:hypothetical protein